MKIGNMKLGLKKKIIPCWVAGYGGNENWKVNIWNPGKAMTFDRHIAYGKANYGRLNPPNYGFEMLERYRKICWLDLYNWEHHYAPPTQFYGPESGRVVLDIGAGCGETALFFHNLAGAKKVICIESDPEAQEVLKKNAEKVKWMKVIAEPFQPHHLFIPHDFMKMDIDGGETVLLGFKPRFVDSVVEIHYRLMEDWFLRHGFNYTPWRYSKNVKVLRNC